MNTYPNYISRAFSENWSSPSMTDYPGEDFLYSDVAENIIRLHFMLETFGVKAGDKIAICGKNSCAWAMSFLSVTTYGTVAVPILHEFSPITIHYIINHSDSRILFVTTAIWGKLNLSELKKVIAVISLNDFSVLYSKDENPTYISELLEIRFDTALMHSICKERFAEHIYQYSPHDLIAINYTSGTTSHPKGVMIPACALSSNIEFGVEVTPMVQSGANVISILPLAHSYSLAFELLVEIVKGIHIHFLTKALHQQYLIDSFADIKPNIIIAVPLILHKIIYKSVYPIIRKKHIQFLHSLPILKPIINSIIRHKLYNMLGGNFYEIIIGGAALDHNVEKFLKDIKIPFTVGYGMTECSPIIGYSDWREFVQGSSGKIVRNMEIKVDSNVRGQIGELLVRGKNVMLGYYKNPQDTTKVLDNEGWMHTGDLGLVDKDGNIFIKGRCKTMFLSANGQNIYPEEIEEYISSFPFVSEVLVVQRSNLLFALIYPDLKSCETNAIEDINQFFTKLLKCINEGLPKYARLAGIEIIKEEFEKTPKKSIKRYLYH